MIRAKLTKIQGNGKSEVRGNEIVGEYVKPPQVGHPFQIVGAPLTQGASFRLVQTSPVKSIDLELRGVKPEKVFFSTENSSYFLTIQ